MQFVRPPNGFRIVIPQTVSDLVDSRADQYPRLPQHWIDIIERLKFVAHREGIRLPEKPAHWIFVADEVIDSGIPRIRLVYKILGDTVTIKMAHICETIDPIE